MQTQRACAPSRFAVAGDGNHLPVLADKRFLKGEVDAKCGILIAGLDHATMFQKPNHSGKARRKAGPLAREIDISNVTASVV